MNYGVYISKKSERLKKFLLQTNDEILSKIKVVVSEYVIEAEFRSLLEQKNIAIVEFEYGELGKNNQERNLRFSDLLLEELHRFQCDYCFSFGSHILAGKLLAVYKNKIINFHPALLPMYPGRKAIDQAVEDNRVLLVGNSAHFIDEGVDSGPLIMQSVIPLQAFLDTNDYNVILDLQIEMMNQIIDIIETDSLDIVDNRVKIKNADYQKSFIFPSWSKDNTQ